MIDVKEIEKILLLFNVGAVVELNDLKIAFDGILKMPEVKERDIFLASFLSFLMCRGKKEEIECVIKTIIEFEKLNFMHPNVQNYKVLGVAGSGKKGLKTINISTPSSIIASSCGAKIIKPGSSATSSLSGSADFISFFETKFSEDIKIEDMLNEISFAFIPIENRFKKFDKIYGHRFYSPTILSFILAALPIPVICDKIIYGLAHPNQEISLDLIQKFCHTKGVIVTTEVKPFRFVDEITPGRIMITSKKGKSILYPENFVKDWPEYSIEDFSQKTSIKENISVAVRAIKGNAEKKIQDVYALNSALYLLESEIVQSIDEGYILSKEAIVSGYAYEHFRKIIKFLDGSLSVLEDIQ